MRRLLRFSVVVVLLLTCSTEHNVSAQATKPSKAAAPETADDWAYYGHDPGGMRYSPLTQINRENVAKLKVAWTYHTGDISDGKERPKRSGFETTPILVDGTLYLTTPFNRVIALDPETGKERWSYDPMLERAGNYGDGLINRGVAVWLDPARARGKPCQIGRAHV